jgi:integrase
MPTTTLTDRMLDRTSRSSGRVELWDTLVPGFGVRITAHQKSFFFSFRSPQAKTAEGKPVRRRVSVGEYPKCRLATARTKAAEIRDQVEHGIDPYYVEPSEPAKLLTFEALALDYLERYARKKKRSWRNDRAIVHNTLIPAWRERLVDSIKPKEVKGLLQAISDRAPVHANRIHEVLRMVFQWGVDEWDLEVNPGRMVKRLNTEFPRERVLTRAEIRSLWHVWERSSDPVASLLRLRLLTAQRGNQLHRLTRTDLDTYEDEVWWNVPSTLTKTRRPYRIWISPLARSVLSRHSPNDQGLYFGWDPEREVSQRYEHWCRTIELSKQCGVTNWQPRDLRRTAATLMAQRGISRFIIKRVLGHADKEITAVYDLYSYDREVKEAVLTLESAVREIVGEPS